MSKALAILILFCHMANADVASFWGHTCNVILNAVKPAQNLAQIERALADEVYKSNSVSHHPVRLERGPLQMLAGNPEGIELRPELNGEHRTVRQLPLTVIVNPSAAKLNWEDSDSGLTGSPSLLIVFENVSVLDEKGANVRVSDVIAEELINIQTTNPGLHFALKSATSAEFPLSFRQEYRDFTVMWIEGGDKNFQVKRSTLLMAQNAYAKLAATPVKH